MGKRIKIVVLDGRTLNPGDLSWGELEELGDCDFYDRTPASEVVNRSLGAEVVLTNKTVLNADQIRALPELRLIGVTATGYNIVDVAAASERRVLVSNVPNYGTRSVAQMTIALLLELCQNAGHHGMTVREGRWSRSPDFCYWDFPLVELDGLTMGIIGYGRIGRAVGELARAFGMRTVSFSRTPDPAAKEVEFVSFEDLLARSDVVSLHCPLTPETKNLINGERLRKMKSSAFLINTSRGPLIDEAALADALNSGVIAGAGLDVLSVEPPPEDQPLFRAKNCLITPHIAWATRAARSRLMRVSVENVRAYLSGAPRNVVNPTS